MKKSTLKKAILRKKQQFMSMSLHLSNEQKQANGYPYIFYNNSPWFNIFKSIMYT